MQLGAIFPQTEIGSDPMAVKDFAQAAESLGYEHLLVFDHVLRPMPVNGKLGNAPIVTRITSTSPLCSLGIWRASRSAFK